MLVDPHVALGDDDGLEDEELLLAQPDPLQSLHGQRALKKWTRPVSHFAPFIFLESE